MKYKMKKRKPRKFSDPKSQLPKERRTKDKGKLSKVIVNDTSCGGRDYFLP